MRRRTWGFILVLCIALTNSAPSLSEMPRSTADKGSLDSNPHTVDGTDPSQLWPHLWPPVRDPGHLTVHLKGFDPIGGRTVLLWWIHGGHARLLGKTRSQPEGAFDFGHIPILQAGQAVTVTSQRGDPLSPAPLWIEGSLR